jgi:hypothetical protein
MFNSKRFVAFIIAVVLFTVMVYTTTYTPIEISGGISVIACIYIGAQSLRGSSPEDTR